METEDMMEVAGNVEENSGVVGALTTEHGGMDESMEAGPIAHANLDSEQKSLEVNGEQNEMKGDGIEGGRGQAVREGSDATEGKDEKVVQHLVETTEANIDTLMAVEHTAAGGNDDTVQANMMAETVMEHVEEDIGETKALKRLQGAIEQTGERGHKETVQTRVVTGIVSKHVAVEAGQSKVLTGALEQIGKGGHEKIVQTRVVEETLMEHVEVGAGESQALKISREHIVSVSPVTTRIADISSTDVVLTEGDLTPAKECYTGFDGMEVDAEADGSAKSAGNHGSHDLPTGVVEASTEEVDLAAEVSERPIMRVTENVGTEAECLSEDANSKGAREDLFRSRVSSQSRQTNSNHNNVTKKLEELRVTQESRKEVIRLGTSADSVAEVVAAGIAAGVAEGITESIAQTIAMEAGGVGQVLAEGVTLEADFARRAGGIDIAKAMAEVIAEGVAQEVARGLAEGFAEAAAVAQKYNGVEVHDSDVNQGNAEGNEDGVQCDCGNIAVVRVVGEKSPNRGLRYLMCASQEPSFFKRKGKKKDSDVIGKCRFFKWVDPPRHTKDDRKKEDKEKLSASYSTRASAKKGNAHVESPSAVGPLSLDGGEAPPSEVPRSKEAQASETLVEAPEFSSEKKRRQAGRQRRGRVHAESDEGHTVAGDQASRAGTSTHFTRGSAKKGTPHHDQTSSLSPSMVAYGGSPEISEQEKLRAPDGLQAGSELCKPDGNTWMRSLEDQIEQTMKSSADAHVEKKKDQGLRISSSKAIELDHLSRISTGGLAGDSSSSGALLERRVGRRGARSSLKKGLSASKAEQQTLDGSPKVSVEDRSVLAGTSEGAAAEAQDLSKTGEKLERHFTRSASKKGTPETVEKQSMVVSPASTPLSLLGKRTSDWTDSYIGPESQDFEKAGHLRKRRSVRGDSGPSSRFSLGGRGSGRNTGFGSSEKKARHYSRRSTGQIGATTAEADNKRAISPLSLADVATALAGHKDEKDSSFRRGNAKANNNSLEQKPRSLSGSSSRKMQLGGGRNKSQASQATEDSPTAETEKRKQSQTRRQQRKLPLSEVYGTVEPLPSVKVTTKGATSLVDKDHSPSPSRVSLGKSTSPDVAMEQKEAGHSKSPLKKRKLSRVISEDNGAPDTNSSKRSAVKKDKSGAHTTSGRHYLRFSLVDAPLVASSFPTVRYAAKLPVEEHPDPDDPWSLDGPWAKKDDKAEKGKGKEEREKEMKSDKRKEEEEEKKDKEEEKEDKEGEGSSKQMVEAAESLIVSETQNHAEYTVPEDSKAPGSLGDMSKPATEEDFPLSGPHMDEEPTIDTGDALIAVYEEEEGGANAPNIQTVGPDSRLLDSDREQEHPPIKEDPVDAPDQTDTLNDKSELAVANAATGEGSEVPSSPKGDENPSLKWSDGLVVHSSEGIANPPGILSSIPADSQLHHTHKAQEDAPEGKDASALSEGYSEHALDAVSLPLAAADPLLLQNKGEAVQKLEDDVVTVQTESKAKDTSVVTRDEMDANSGLAPNSISIPSAEDDSMLLQKVIEAAQERKNAVASAPDQTKENAEDSGAEDAFKVPDNNEPLAGENLILLEKENEVAQEKEEAAATAPDQTEGNAEDTSLLRVAGDAFKVSDKSEPSAGNDPTLLEKEDEAALEKEAAVVTGPELTEENSGGDLMVLQKENKAAQEMEEAAATAPDQMEGNALDTAFKVPDNNEHPAGEDPMLLENKDEAELVKEEAVATAPDQTEGNEEATSSLPASGVDLKVPDNDEPLAGEDSPMLLGKEIEAAQEKEEAVVTAPDQTEGSAGDTSLLSSAGDAFKLPDNAEDDQPLTKGDSDHVEQAPDRQGGSNESLVTEDWEDSGVHDERKDLKRGSIDSVGAAAVLEDLAKKALDSASLLAVEKDVEVPGVHIDKEISVMNNDDSNVVGSSTQNEGSLSGEPLTAIINLSKVLGSDIQDELLSTRKSDDTVIVAEAASEVMIESTSIDPAELALGSVKPAESFEKLSAGIDTQNEAIVKESSLSGSAASKEGAIVETGEHTTCVPSEPALDGRVKPAEKLSAGIDTQTEAVVEESSLSGSATIKEAAIVETGDHTTSGPQEPLLDDSVKPAESFEVLASLTDAVVEESSLSGDATIEESFIVETGVRTTCDPPESLHEESFKPAESFEKPSAGTDTQAIVEVSSFSSSAAIREGAIVEVGDHITRDPPEPVRDESVKPTKSFEKLSDGTHTQTEAVVEVSSFSCSATIREGAIVETGDLNTRELSNLPAPVEQLPLKEDIDLDDLVKPAESSENWAAGVDAPAETVVEESLMSDSATMKESSIVAMGGPNPLDPTGLPGPVEEPPSEEDVEMDEAVNDSILSKHLEETNKDVVMADTVEEPALQESTVPGGMVSECPLTQSEKQAESSTELLPADELELPNSNSQAAVYEKEELASNQDKHETGDNQKDTVKEDIDTVEAIAEEPAISGNNVAAEPSPNGTVGQDSVEKVRLPTSATRPAVEKKLARPSAGQEHAGGETSQKLDASRAPAASENAGFVDSVWRLASGRKTRSVGSIGAPAVTSKRSRSVVSSHKGVRVGETRGGSRHQAEAQWVDVPLDWRNEKSTGRLLLLPNAPSKSLLDSGTAQSSMRHLHSADNQHITYDARPRFARGEVDEASNITEEKEKGHDASARDSPESYAENPKQAANDGGASELGVSEPGEAAPSFGRTVSTGADDLKGGKTVWAVRQHRGEQTSSQVLRQSHGSKAVVDVQHMVGGASNQDVDVAGGGENIVQKRKRGRPRKDSKKPIIERQAGVQGGIGSQEHMSGTLTDCKYQKGAEVAASGDKIDTADGLTQAVDMQQAGVLDGEPSTTGVGNEAMEGDAVTERHEEDKGAQLERSASNTEKENRKHDGRVSSGQGERGNPAEGGGVPSASVVSFAGVTQQELVAPFCACKFVQRQAVMKTIVRSGDPNQGLRYWSCSNYKKPFTKKRKYAAESTEESCKYFRWLDTPRVTANEKREARKERYRQVELQRLL